MVTPPTPEATKSLELREAAYRYVNAILLVLLGLGVLTATTSAIWAEVGLGTVTLVFAVLKATSNWRIALYALTGPVAGALGAYGLLQGVDWAVITMAVAQALGITTAAAKVVVLPKDEKRTPIVA